MWGKRGQAIIVSNDAKGCYDRIAHVVVNLALRRLGIPKPPLRSMIATIQCVEHYMRTAFGDLDQHCDNNDGVLQGNGSGPAVWFGVSTVLINILKKEGCGHKEWTLIRRRAF